MKALELDPSMPEAHLSLAAYLLIRQRDRVGAEREIERVVRSSPSLSEIYHLRSFYFMTMGRYDEAISDSRKALACDPFSVT